MKRLIIASALGVVVLIIGGFGLVAAGKTFHRYQVRADAENQVRVYNIQIRQQAQRVKIAKQNAEIRRQDAIGVREAQDEIAKTLTPLYVQFEMTEALKAIATSGSNNSTVFIPAGAAGIPLISNANPKKVEQP
jgi:hypothetical protein